MAPSSFRSRLRGSDAKPARQAKRNAPTPRDHSEAPLNSGARRGAGPRGWDVATREGSATLSVLLLDTLFFSKDSKLFLDSGGLQDDILTVLSSIVTHYDSKQ